MEQLGYMVKFYLKTWWDEGLEIQFSGESTLPHKREDLGSDPQKLRRSQTL